MSTPGAKREQTMGSPMIERKKNSNGVKKRHAKTVSMSMKKWGGGGSEIRYIRNIGLGWKNKGTQVGKRGEPSRGLKKKKKENGTKKGEAGRSDRGRTQKKGSVPGKDQGEKSNLGEVGAILSFQAGRQT